MDRLGSVTWQDHPVSELAGLYDNGRDFDEITRSYTPSQPEAQKLTQQG
jgi:hypothetical protein